MPFLRAKPPLGPSTRKIDGKHKVHEQDSMRDLARIEFV
jgi:hypothetical protein